MSDSSRFNSPSRKSRFRAQGRSRPVGYTADPAAAEDEPGEEIAASDELEAQQDPYPSGPDEERVAAEDDAIPAGLRLTRDPDQVVALRGLSKRVTTTLILLALAAGAIAGYFFGHAQGRNASGRRPLIADEVKTKALISVSNESRAAFLPCACPKK